MSTTARLHGLDTLRALAVSLVVLHHYVLFVSHRPTFGWVGEIGWAGVDLFFALSGYLIGNQIFKSMRSGAGFSLKNFYARRFLRTLPNFWAVLALYALWPSFRGDAPLLPLWKYLSFTQNHHLEPGTAFSHAWSLSIEEQFYMVLPAVALVAASMRRSIGWVWLAIAAAFAAGMLTRATLWQEVVEDQRWWSHHYYKYIYYSTFCRFDELLAGVALALLKNYHPAAWRRVTGFGNAIFAAGAAVIGLAFWLFLRDYGYGPEHPGAIAFMLLLSLLAGWLLYRLVETPFMALRDRYVPSNAPGTRPALDAISSGTAPVRR